MIRPSAPAATGGGHPRHQRRVARAMAGIDHHGQVRAVVQIGHRGQREREPRVRLESADAPFAKHHVGIAGIEDIFGRQQELVETGAGPRFNKTGLPSAPTASSRR